VVSARAIQAINGPQDNVFTLIDDEILESAAVDQ
jgi:hypothetical protein